MTTHRARRAVAASAAAVIALLVAGCGEQESSPAPQIGGDPAAGGSPSESGTNGSTGAAQPFDEEGYQTHRGRVEAENAKEKAVADAWFAYWDVHSAAYYNVEVDADALGEVARGDALTGTVEYVRYLRKNGLHTEGDSKMGLSLIEVRDGTAGVQGCVENKSVDVDANGEPAEEPRPYLQMTGMLAKVGDAWLVQSWQVTGEEKCRA